MGRGKNICESIDKYAYNSLSRGSFYAQRKPVVFLSHKSEDKAYVEKIGEYFMSADIDIYLDKYDKDLQSATNKGDAKKITECIQNGIDNSDYILCITSKSTINSWWVPFEIGYGKNANKKISTLVRKDVIDIPAFLEIEPVMKTIPQLNNFIREITEKHRIPINESSTITKYASTGQIQSASYNHPLYEYLTIR